MNIVKVILEIYLALADTGCSWCSTQTYRATHTKYKDTIITLKRQNTALNQITEPGAYYISYGTRWCWTFFKILIFFCGCWSAWYAKYNWMQWLDESFDFLYYIFLLLISIRRQFKCIFNFSFEANDHQTYDSWTVSFALYSLAVV